VFARLFSRVAQFARRRAQSWFASTVVSAAENNVVGVAGASTQYSVADTVVRFVEERTLSRNGVNQYSVAEFGRIRAEKAFANNAGDSANRATTS